MDETKNWTIHKHTYSQGKCSECGSEGKITITDKIGRCQKCHIDWLIEEAKKQ